MKKGQFDPQVIKKGNWKVRESNKPCVSLRSQVLDIPLGDTPKEQSCRAHEFGHIAFSLRKHQKYYKLPEFQAIEDCRVNVNLGEEGINVAHIVEDGDGVAEQLKQSFEAYKKSPYIEDAMKEQDSSMQFMAGCMWLASEGLGKDNSIREACQTILTDTEQLFLKGLKKFIKDNRTDPEVAVKASALFDKYFLPSEQEKQKKGKKKPGDGDESDEKGKPQSAKDYLNARAMKFREKRQDIAEKVKEMGNSMYGKDRDGRYVKTTSTSSLHWGDYSVVKPPLPRRQAKAISKIVKKRATDEGTIFRYPHRFMSDKAVFCVKARRQGTGTILLDMSGSMPWSSSELMGILDIMPHATVLGYSTPSGTAHGQIFVLAYHGRTVDYIPEHGGQNGIDGPALEYMISNYRGPYYFVTDKYFTAYPTDSKREVGMSSNEPLKKEVEKLSERKNVKYVGGYHDLMDSLKSKHRAG